MNKIKKNLGIAILLILFLTCLTMLLVLKVPIYEPLSSEIINNKAYLKSEIHLHEVYCNINKQVTIYNNLDYLGDGVYEVKNDYFIKTSKPFFYFKREEMNYLRYFLNAVFKL
ncbi:hypothetical protein [Mesoplasma lactucae]|uniref:Uncharacterized protein n=1 Tax=Mesoplasma lactucae ATCC 49193 TaxID=81460 RepID=A0A291IRD4_9MOLU|nr:hypothetical protein [Mesoplasma lactucae]ATG97349.1 hypothetical protein CP520_01075 [Mesoplasma lactucae ATCC 49193]ATZ20199.1 hypothetical protein MLACT_v1c03780 [Mesoplasma lactucae ATCC 49193]MCL8216948.1 hypothetical protein [Mesoplasma lactucae ATCC 49193]